MHTDIATTIQPVVAGIAAVSTGRVGAFVAGAAGLIGAVLGGLALAHAARRARSASRVDPGAGRGAVTLSLGLGLSSLVVAGLVIATSDGGIGTGNGLGGAIVALALGLIAIVLGGLALCTAPGIAVTRSRERRCHFIHQSILTHLTRLM